MASMILTVPDEVAQRVVDGFAHKHGYQETVTDDDTGDEIPNPESKFDFMGRIISEYVMESVEHAEVVEAGRAARQAARDAVRSEIGPITVEREVGGQAK